MSEGARFLEGISRHLDAFAADAGVPAGDVSVRITLVDGTVATAKGLGAATQLAAGWGMIEGLGADQSEAVVVRESGIVKVEFALSERVIPPIGFGTETLPR